jgi:cytochrome c oxidase subunit 2
MPAIMVALALLLIGLPRAAADDQDRKIIRINAERFAFTPSRIEVAAGEEVELRIRSDDTSHGFRIVGTETNLTIPKRGKGEIVVSLRLEKPGSYVFECSRMCGAGHNFMRGELVVRERQTDPGGQ